MTCGSRFRFLFSNGYRLKLNSVFHFFEPRSSIEEFSNYWGKIEKLNLQNLLSTNFSVRFPKLMKKLKSFHRSITILIHKWVTLSAEMMKNYRLLLMEKLMQCRKISELLWMSKWLGRYTLFNIFKYLVYTLHARFLQILENSIQKIDV